MAKKKSAQKRKARAVAKMAKPASSAGRVPRQVKGDLAQYLSMLADPCNAEFARAPYGGTGSGYVMRCKTIIPISSGSHTDATTSVSSGVVTIVPGLGVYYIAHNRVGQTGEYYQSFVNDFITAEGDNSGIVQKYRVLAACAKFVPTGTYANRRGSVGRTYSPGGQESYSGIITEKVNPLLALGGCNRVSPAGSEEHEVRWLPGFEDQSWTSTNDHGATQDAYGADHASLSIVLESVDSTHSGGTGGQSNWTISVNGYIEYTAIYEWVPDLSRATPGATDTKASVPPIIAKPPSFTLNEAMRAIGDLGSFVTPGLRSMGVQLLTNGVKAMSVAGPPMLSLM